MYIKLYSALPDEAIMIRNEVFVKEQGFINEFDAVDNFAIHFVLFEDNGNPVATCRIFKENGKYFLGRVAVLKPFRGKNHGSDIVREAEKHIISLGADSLTLHSQSRIKEFYHKLGYSEFGETDYDESCPHIWMKKELK